jgi:hypothetical protein
MEHFLSTAIIVALSFGQIAPEFFGTRPEVSRRD